MPIYKVKVKWGREAFNDVEVNTDEDPIVFKAQLFTLTGVQPERQKVMVKGTTLKDEAWDGVKVNNGATILMMGSKEDLPPEPTEKRVFLEDMSDHELAAALEMPPGLTNLGNTCYINATVQCLRAVPELRESLKKYSGSITGLGPSIVPAQSITSAVRDLFESMEKSSIAIPPVILLQVLHIAFPRFAEKSEHGGFVQQDANECWTEIMRMLQQKLPAQPCPENSNQASAPKYTSFIDQYFGGTLDSVLTCTESEKEPETVLKENFLQLSCFITQEVKYMLSGLKQRMQETIVKYSSTLERDAKFQKTSKISRLPAYLTVQFLRFYYKEKESVNAKILKDIKFSLTLDAFGLCTKELQDKLMPIRAKFKEVDDKQVEQAQKAKLAGPEEVPKPEPKKVKLPYYFADDVGSNNSGFYELIAVLTHKGRSSSSGHYVAWVKHTEEEWLKFDDDKVSIVTPADIVRLSGGGDWHCAYLLLYGPRILEVPEDEASEFCAAAAATSS